MQKRQHQDHYKEVAQKEQIVPTNVDPQTNSAIRTGAEAAAPTTVHPPQVQSPHKYALLINFLITITQSQKLAKVDGKIPIINILKIFGLEEFEIEWEWDIKNHSKDIKQLNKKIYYLINAINKERLKHEQNPTESPINNFFINRPFPTNKPHDTQRFNIAHPIWSKFPFTANQRANIGQNKRPYHQKNTHRTASTHTVSGTDVAPTTTAITTTAAAAPVTATGATATGATATGATATGATATGATATGATATGATATGATATGATATGATATPDTPRVRAARARAAAAAHTRATATPTAATHASPRVRAARARAAAAAHTRATATPTAATHASPLVRTARAHAAAAARARAAAAAHTRATATPAGATPASPRVRTARARAAAAARTRAASTPADGSPPAPTRSGTAAEDTAATARSAAQWKGAIRDAAKQRNHSDTTALDGVKEIDIRIMVGPGKPARVIVSPRTGDTAKDTIAGASDAAHGMAWPARASTDGPPAASV